MSPLSRVAVAAVLLAAGLALSQWVRGLVAWVDTNPARLGFEMMGIEIGLAAVAIAVATALPGSIPDHLGLRAARLPVHAVVALVVGTLALSLALEAVLQLSRQLEGSVITGISRGIASARSQPSGLWIAFFGTVIAPAVGEELLCRGLVQRGLARWFRPWLAIVAASLFFGWLHMEMVHGTVALCVGLYLGLVAHWCDSTRPAIAAHAANNLAALLGSTGLLSLRVPLPVALFGGAALAALALVWARRSRPRGASAAAAARGDSLQAHPGSADA